MKEEQFVEFVNKLKTEENGALIEAVVEGFKAIALVEGLEKSISPKDAQNADLRRAVMLLDASMNKTISMIDQMRLSKESAIMNRVAGAMREALSNRTFDSAFASAMKDNLQKMESGIATKVQLTEDRANALGDTFEALYRRIFDVVQEQGYAM